MNDKNFKLNLVKITRAEESDLPLLAGLISELFAIESDFSTDIAKQERGLAMLLANQETCLILKAEYDNKLIGMVTVQLVISTAEGGWSGLLEDLVVSKSYRAAGVGTLLINAAETWCKQKQATRIHLLADKTNTPALNFYRRRGYQDTLLICKRKFFT